MEIAPTGNVFVRAWGLLRRNGIVIVPGLAAGILSWIASGAALGLVPDPALTDSAVQTNAVASTLVRAFAVAAVELFAMLLAITFTTGMAAAAWRSGRAALTDGSYAFQRDGVQVAVTLALLYALGLAATLLAPVTAFLSLLAYVYFCIYSVPAAVVGERTGPAAIRESARLALARPGPTFGMLTVIVAIVLVSGLVASVLALVPAVGPVLSAMLNEAVVSYVTLVVVGDYLILRGPEDAGRSLRATVGRSGKS